MSVSGGSPLSGGPLGTHAIAPLGPVICSKNPEAIAAASLG